MKTTSQPGDKPLAPDRRPTATQLKKVYRDGLDSALADFIFLQQELPAHPVINRQINEASADYYQWLIDTDDDKAAEMSAEYVVRLTAREFDEHRIERLRMIVAARAQAPCAISPNRIKQIVGDCRLPYDRINHDIIKRALWPAFRDASRDGEAYRQFRAGTGPAPSSASDEAPIAPATTAPIEPVTAVPAEPGVSIEDAMEACITAARPTDGKPWASEVQVRIAIRLLVHVAGADVAIGTLSQRHLGELATLMKQLPNRWGRTREELADGLSASLARAKTLPAQEVGVASKTQQKHFTWVRKVVEYAVRHGYGPATPLRYADFRKDNREPAVRSRNLRDKWTKAEITRLLEAPIFAGCVGLRDT